VLRTHTCVDCQIQVPPHDDESALISMKYGWRLTRKLLDDGTSLLQWRCPRCWARYREARQPTETPKREGET